MPRWLFRWKATAILLLAVETAALFWAYYAFGLGRTIRGLEAHPLVVATTDEISAAIRGVVPAWVASSLAGFAAAIGLSGGFREAFSIGAALGSGLNASSLGSAFVAPAYFAFRRLVRRPTTPAPGNLRRAVAWRIRPARAKVLEPIAPASTAVQEAL